jgi:hypothetical protein
VEGFRSRCRGCRRYGLPLPWRTPFLLYFLLLALASSTVFLKWQRSAHCKFAVGTESTWVATGEGRPRKGSKDEVDGGGDELRWDEGSRNRVLQRNTREKK